MNCAFDASNVVGLDSWQTVLDRDTGRFGDPAIKPVRVLAVQKLIRVVAGSNGQERVPSNTVKITFEGTVRPKLLCIDYLKIRVRLFTQRAMFCDRCQKLGHTNKILQTQAECGRCDKEHKTEECNDPTKNKRRCVRRVMLCMDLLGSIAHMSGK